MVLSPIENRRKESMWIFSSNFSSTFSDLIEAPEEHEKQVYLEKINEEQNPVRCGTAQ